MVKTEVIGWQRRKLARIIERSQYPTLQDEERNESHLRYEKALRAELESLLPFFFLSYLWLHNIPSTFDAVPFAFEAICLSYVLLRFAHSFALFWRYPTARLIFWAAGIFLLVALSGWLLTIVFFAAPSSGVGAMEVVVLALVLLVLHQLVLGIVTERARYATGIPQVPEDTIRLLVSVQLVPNLVRLSSPSRPLCLTLSRRTSMVLA